MAVDFGSGEGMAELGHVGIGLRAAAAPAVRPSLFFFRLHPCNIRELTCDGRF